MIGARELLRDSLNFLLQNPILFFDSLSCWIKVGLSWLSCSKPLAMPPRTRLVLCQERITDTIFPLSPEKVSHFLLNKIQLSYILSLKMPL